MNDILKLFVSLSVSGSITALVLFLLLPIIKARLSKSWQYYIWLAVIIRLSVPFSIEFNIVGQLFQKAEERISVKDTNTYTAYLSPYETDVLQEIFLQSTSGQTASSYLNDLRQNIWLLWLVPAIVLFERKVMSYRGFVRYIKAGLTEPAERNTLAVFETACRDMGLKKPLHLYVNKLCVSPMLVGIFRPFVVLPDTNLKDDELYNIFLHELTHYKRMDIIYKWVAQTAFCLHWFNPLVYIINSELNKSCELSCDEAVIKNLDTDGRKKYGDTLLTSLKFNGNYGNAVASVTLNEDAALLKERLCAIMKFKNKSVITKGLTTVLTVSILCVTTISGAYASPENQKAGSPKNLNLTESDEDTSSSFEDAQYNDADDAAIKLMTYSGNWEITELLIPYMTKGGIDELAEIYNRQNLYSNKSRKNPEDYYNIAGTNTAEADARALIMMQKNGMLEYAMPFFPYMSNSGIDKVISLYNQKHFNKKPLTASDYYNGKENKSDEAKFIDSQNLSSDSYTNAKAVINLSNNNTFNISESGSFEVNDEQTLLLDIFSTISGGTVHLFLFDPSGAEQIITISHSDLTIEIKLTKGLWQYNCSGIFKNGGELSIKGVIY